MSDTAPVGITVSALAPVSGKGDVKFLARVTLDIGGVVLALHGWTLRQDKAGGMRPHLPAYRDPRTGAWAACVGPPEDLLRAVGEALLAQVPDVPGLIRPPGGAPDSA